MNRALRFAERKGDLSNAAARRLSEVAKGSENGLTDRAGTLKPCLL
jgi:hypothetical protein